MEKAPWMILMSGASFPQPPHSRRALFFIIDTAFFTHGLKFLRALYIVEWQHPQIYFLKNYNFNGNFIYAFS